MEPKAISKKENKWFLWVMAGMVLTTFIGLFTLGMLKLKETNLYRNIYVESISVGGLSKEAAIEKLKDFFDRDIDERQMILEQGENRWIYSYGDFGYHYDYQEAVDQAYEIGRKGNVVERLLTIYRLRKEPAFISLKGLLDPEMVDKVLDQMEEVVYRAPEDAQLSRVNGTFQIKEEVPGIALDRIALREQIESYVAAYENRVITVPVSQIEPKIKAAQLRQMDTVLGSYGTTFDTRVTGRSANINLASKSVNGTLLMPGESFSFNESTGPRSIKEGYQEAPVIVNGELVPGIGGGICQVSSTLYNAVLRADLEIISRRNHSLAVAYLPLGQDATVSYGYIDFIFANNTNYPIYIESVVNGNKLTVNIHGKKEKDTTVTLHSVVNETIEPKIEYKEDPNLYVGEEKVEKEGKRGYKVSTYKIYLKDGKEVKRELVSKDTYITSPRVILRGTKVSPPEDQTTLAPPSEQQEEAVPPVI